MVGVNELQSATPSWTSPTRALPIVLALWLLVLVCVAGARQADVLRMAALGSLALAGVGCLWHKRITGWMAWPLALACYGLIGCLNPSGWFDIDNDRIVAIEQALDGLPTTVDRSISWRATIDLVGLGCLLPLAVVVGRSYRSAQQLVAVLGCGLFVWMLVGGVARAGEASGFDLVANSSDWTWRHGMPYGTIDYHGNAGTLIVITGVLAGSVLMAVGRGLGRQIWPMVVLCLLSIAAAMVNSSRIGLVLALTIVPLYTLIAIIYLRQGRRDEAASQVRSMLIFLVGTLLICCVSSQVRAQNSIQRLEELPGYFNSEHYPRWMENELAMELFRERPVWGFGPGTYALVSDESRIEGHFFVPAFVLGQTREANHHAKQDALQLLVSWGVVGAAIFAVPVLFAGYAMVRSRALPRPARHLQWVLAGVIAVVLLHGLGDCTLQLPATQAITLVVLGLLIASRSWTSTGSHA